MISFRTRGFTLVELLTVIAIIAILAAIIFPVMASVKEQARKSQCMTNMKQIATAVQLFKQDNRRFPAMISADYVVGQSFDQAKLSGYLYPEYVRTVDVFHCPSSPFKNKTEASQYWGNPPANTVVRTTYAYDSYSGFVAPGTTMASGVYEATVRYCIDWAADVGAVGNYAPAGGADDAAKQQSDYERQLKFRNPPADTVVTWCSYHGRDAEGPSPTGQAIVVFLDGNTKVISSAEMKASRWRARP